MSDRLVYADPSERIDRTKKIDEELLLEREKEIQELQQDMLTINELFTQIACMVEAQGPDVIQVGKNIASSEIEVAKGVKELQSASDSQKSCNLL